MAVPDPQVELGMPTLSVRLCETVGGHLNASHDGLLVYAASICGQVPTRW